MIQVHFFPRLVTSFSQRVSREAEWFESKRSQSCAEQLGRKSKQVSSAKWNSIAWKVKIVSSAEWILSPSLRRIQPVGILLQNSAISRMNSITRCKASTFLNLAKFSFDHCAHLPAVPRADARPLHLEYARTLHFGSQISVASLLYSCLLLVEILGYSPHSTNRRRL